MFAAISTGIFAALVAAPAIGHAVTREPQIVEFGPTFRSPLGGIVIGRDGAIWVAQSDGAARMTRDGEVVQIRRPDDCRASPVYVREYEACANEQPAIGIGFGGDVWTNGSDRLLRFGIRGVRQFDVSTSPKMPTAIVGFAATERGVFTSRSGETGLRIAKRAGEEHRVMRDAGFVTFIVPRSDGALWLLVRGRKSAEIGRFALARPCGTRSYATRHRFGLQRYARLSRTLCRRR